MGFKSSNLTHHDLSSTPIESVEKSPLKKLIENLEWRDLNKSAKKDLAIGAYKNLSY